MYKTHTYDDPEQKPSMYEELEENEVFTPGYDEGVFKQVGNKANSLSKKRNTTYIPKESVQIVFASGIKQDIVSDHAMSILKEIASQAGLKRLFVTSTYRSPDHQMKIMYENIK